MFAVSTASAQQQTQRVAGTIDKVDGKTLYIKSAGGPVTLTLADNALIVARVIRPASKLSTLSRWADCTLGPDLAVADASPAWLVVSSFQPWSTWSPMC